MSHVDNCILNLSLLDKGKLEKINEFFDDGRRGFVDVDEIANGWYGGSKYLETCVCMAAFNHVNLSKLIEHIRSLKFTIPDSVQLFIQGQNADKFQLVDIFEETT